MHRWYAQDCKPRPVRLSKLKKLSMFFSNQEARHKKKQLLLTLHLLYGITWRYNGWILTCECFIEPVLTWWIFPVSLSIDFETRNEYFLRRKRGESFICLGCLICRDSSQIWRLLGIRSSSLTGQARKQPLRSFTAKGLALWLLQSSLVASMK